MHTIFDKKIELHLSSQVLVGSVSNLISNKGQHFHKWTCYNMPYTDDIAYIEISFDPLFIGGIQTSDIDILKQIFYGSYVYSMTVGDTGPQFMISKSGLVGCMCPSPCKSDSEIEIQLQELNKFVNWDLDLILIMTCSIDILSRTCINLGG